MKMSKTLSTLASALKQARIDLANAKLEVARLAEGVKLEHANAKAAKAATAEAKAAAKAAKAKEAADAKAAAEAAAAEPAAEAVVAEVKEDAADA